ncbi:MAG: AmmeMemoRadiSam system protein B [Candidatus Micrarchaeia archaeon]
MREPAVAGSFYPHRKSEILKMLEQYFGMAAKSAKPEECVAGISPHAGYEYSGAAAAVTYNSIRNIKSAKTVVFIGPNHTGIGTPVSVSLDDWATPLGVCGCDRQLAEKIISNSSVCRDDESAHAAEHSIEVQLPFLQFLNPRARIVCICMGDTRLETALDLSSSLSKSISSTRDTVLVASSDFTHYEKAEAAKERDMEAMKLIEKLDMRGFSDSCRLNGWSICGHGPITAAIGYAKAKGCKKAKLLKYTNSGEGTGDYSSVVAYSSVIFPK